MREIIKKQNRVDTSLQCKVKLDETHTYINQWKREFHFNNKDKVKERKNKKKGKWYYIYPGNMNDIWLKEEEKGIGFEELGKEIKWERKRREKREKGSTVLCDFNVCASASLLIFSCNSSYLLFSSIFKVCFLIILFYKF